MHFFLLKQLGFSTGFFLKNVTLGSQKKKRKENVAKKDIKKTLKKTRAINQYYNNPHLVYYNSTAKIEHCSEIFALI